MKTNFFSRFFAIGMIAAALIVGCEKDNPKEPDDSNGGNNSGNTNGGGSSNTTGTIYNLTPSDKITVSFGGKGIAATSEEYAADNTKKEASVTFNRFPVSVAEFKELINTGVANKPEGAVALTIMAMEMYLHDVNIGNECIKLISSTPSQASLVVQSIKNHIVDYKEYNFLFAGLLQGAERTNGFNPTEPYTVEMYLSPSIKYQYSKTFDAEVIYIDVKNKLSDGTADVRDNNGNIIGQVPAADSKRRIQVVMSDQAAIGDTKFTSLDTSGYYFKDLKPAKGTTYKGVKPFGNRYGNK